ncbi:MAG: hypothetical protein IJH63_10500 [Methanobrevibacter sp.]|nr:hypothetical protein [Methanobrevibacter sp.]
MEDEAVFCWGVFLLAIVAIGIVGYDEATAEYSNVTVNVVDKVLNFQGRGHDIPVYYVYTDDYVFSVSLSDYNSLHVGDNVTLGVRDEGFKSAHLYLNGHEYDSE